MRQRLSRLLPVALLDIGTSKTACWIVRSREDRKIDILGACHQKTRGYCNGRITDLQALSGCVAQAVEKAEQDSKGLVRYAILALDGALLSTFTQSVEVPLLSAHVTKEDLKRLEQAAIAKIDKRVLHVIHVLPQNYFLDSEGGIENPTGMAGSVLKARLLIICAKASLVRNLLLAVEKAHLEILALVAAPYVTGFSCLTEGEKQLRVALCDIGAGGVTITGYKSGTLQTIKRLNCGGAHMTKDLAYGLDTDLPSAERIKILQGSCLRGAKSAASLSYVGTHALAASIPQERIFDIIYPRAEEILNAIKIFLDEDPHLGSLTRRVVLTGGVSQMPGFRELAQTILGRSVQLAEDRPNHTRTYRTKDLACFPVLEGLVLYTQTHDTLLLPTLYFPSLDSNFLGKIISWFRENLW